jgi:hypothetical protein
MNFAMDAVPRYDRLEIALRKKYKNASAAMAALGLDAALLAKPRRYGDTRRLGRDDDPGDGPDLESLIEQIKALAPEDQDALIDALMGDEPGEDRRRARDRRGRARDNDYPVERSDLDDPGEIGDLPREMPGDRRRAADEPPPFYGRPEPGGSIDLTEGQPDLAVRRRATGAGEDRRHAMDAARRIRTDTVGIQPHPRASRGMSASFAKRFPSAGRIKVL